MREPFAHARRVRYVEVDAQGVVYNAHYLTWFDEAVTEFMRAIGRPVLPAAGLAFDFHTVRGAVDFHRPIAYDEQVKVTVEIAKVGNSSITFTLGVRDAASIARASGELVWVYTDQETGKSAALPDELRADLVNQLQ